MKRLSDKRSVRRATVIFLILLAHSCAEAPLVIDETPQQQENPISMRGVTLTFPLADKTLDFYAEEIHTDLMLSAIEFKHVKLTANKKLEIRAPGARWTNKDKLWFFGGVKGVLDDLEFTSPDLSCSIDTASWESLGEIEILGPSLSLRAQKAGGKLDEKSRIWFDEPVVILKPTGKP